MNSFIDTLRERVILFDGAMGTEIYNRGVFINRCYDEVSLTNPDMVIGNGSSTFQPGASLCIGACSASFTRELLGQRLVPECEGIE